MSSQVRPPAKLWAAQPGLDERIKICLLQAGTGETETENQTLPCPGQGRSRQPEKTTAWLVPWGGGTTNEIMALPSAPF